jgi:hypothetical protein
MKKVILLMLIVIPVLLKAQQKTGAVVAPLYPLIHKTPVTLMSGISPVFPSVFSSAQLKTTTPKAKSPVGPRDYYQQCFGYFCKREWDWEKQTKVPVKLRLGNYQETQRIEGKH